MQATAVAQQANTMPANFQPVGVGAANVASPTTPMAGGGNFFRGPDGSWNTNNIGMILGGIQSLGSLWNSFQQNKLARESLGLQKKAFKTNLANQRQTYNTALEDRIRSRYAYEGRSDQDAEKYLEKNRL
jgi:hypothetical protein